MVTHSSILAWKIQEQRRLAGCSLWGPKESDMTEHACTSESEFKASAHYIPGAFRVGPRLFPSPYHHYEGLIIPCIISALWIPLLPHDVSLGVLLLYTPLRYFTVVYLFFTIWFVSAQTSSDKWAWQWWLCWVVSSSVPARLLCPRGSPGRNTGVGWHALFQQSSWPRDLTCVSSISYIGRRVLYHLAAWEAHGESSDGKT